MKKPIRRAVYKFVRSAIFQADDIEINEIINTVTRRYADRFPDWEVMFLSMPRHDQAERERTAKYLYDMIKRHPVIEFL